MAMWNSRLPVQNETIIKIGHDQPNATDLVTDKLIEWLSQVSSDRDLVIVCVGTDRSTGDALGPLVGSRLIEHRCPNFKVYGTLDEPVHAMNLDTAIDVVYSRHSNPFVIGVDACLGQSTSVGHIQLGTGPVKPGAGVNKDLPPVGDIHITGVVNVGGFMEYFVLQNTRLHLVMNIAKVISNCILYSATSVRSRITPAATLD